MRFPIHARLVRPAALASLSAVALAAPAPAQVQPLPGLVVEYGHDSGQVENGTGGPAIVTSFVVDVPGAPWLRLHLDGTDLSGDPWRGSGAVLRITSLADGALQTMDARHLAQWQYRSAYFNGDAVLVECLAEDGMGMSRVVVTGVTAGVPGTIVASQCGPLDDRVLSNDPRMGRAIPIGCTAWLIDDCQRCFLTAGHCTGGSLQTVEFNVPLSDPVTGANQHPPPSDQYAVDPASVLTNGGQGTGNDWGYFGVFANSTTGLTPFEAMGQSFAVIGGALPPFAAGEPIRITGYGNDFDTPAHDNAQQTHSGPWVTFSGTLVQYQTDTEGGNSGSPIAHEPTGQALGIHTHGGCSTSGSGQNSGTMLSHPGLQAALADPQGVCAGGIRVIDAPLALEPGVPAAITLSITGTVVAGTERMWWRLDGGTYQQQALTPFGGGAYEATLVAQACSDSPEFYFTAEIEGCGTVSDPPGAPFNVHTALVGVEVSILQDDFQTDQGWAVQDGAGLTTGTWERVVPLFNDRGDPPADADGSGMCYVTDNALNADVDGGTTILTSQPMDLSAGALVSYSYWLNSTSASSFGAEDSMQVEVSTDPAGATWTLLRDYRTIEESWRSDTIAVGVEVPASATLRIRFSVSDVSPADVVEGGLDAVEVFRLDCAGSMTAFCFGDGTGAACPCANTGLPGRGCDNAQHTGGVQLGASGDPLVNSVVLAGTHFPAGTSPAVVAIRSPLAQVPAAFLGDGLRCLSTAGLVRITSGLAGGGAVALPINHGAGPGTFHYQLWYRSNPASYCTPEAFNLSNGLTIVWP